MDRLSALDTSFLRIETPSAHMHVGWLAIAGLPAGTGRLGADAIKRSIEARLHLAPRFRRRVIERGIGEPVWADDPAFSIDRHVVEHAGPRLSRAALGRLCDEFLSSPLDRSRPLWQIMVVPRVAAGRAAILGKIHHAMVDGIAAVELGMLLFDLAPDPAPAQPIDWEPARLPGPLRLAIDGATDGALEQFRAAGRIASLGLQPRRSLRVADTVRRAAFALAEEAIRPAPATWLNPQIGPQRTLVTRSLELWRVDRLKQRLDAKLNDVILAIVSGALRSFAAVCEQPEVPLRAMIPVNVRGAGESGSGGNRITFGFTDLPCDEPDPRRRLSRIHAAMEELKASGRVGGGDALLRSAGTLPGFVQERAARVAASPRMYNVVVSNVPGPRLPLYVGGARVESIYPVIPVTEGHALSFGVLSYEGALHFTAYADPEALPKAPALAGLIGRATQELEAAAGLLPSQQPKHVRDRALYRGAGLVDRARVTREVDDQGAAAGAG